MELTLVRHGQSTANRDGILQGQTDAALSDLGRRQARQLGAWFRERGMSWDAVYCSPLARARDTARIIVQVLERDPPIDAPELAEVHAGEMQGKTGSALRRDHPAFYVRSITELGDYAEFGGESYLQVQARVQTFIARLAERHRAGEQRVLVVSHGGLLFQLAKALICVPVPRALFLRFGNCSATRLHLRERRGAYIGEIEWHLPLDMMGGEPSGGAASLLY